MRICRFSDDGQIHTGWLVDDETVLSIDSAAQSLLFDLPSGLGPLDLLPGGAAHALLKQLEAKLDGGTIRSLARPAADVRLLVPIANPPKILLLAGNYAKHVHERGGRAEERSKTFPYLFLKPSTTLTHPGDSIRLPACSPDQIDWEAELGVVIGRTCKGVAESEALQYVAGYTIINDISDRGFRPVPQRTDRPKDTFFDWQHGKWHDTFCPMGPAILPADECPDPQSLRISLSVNGAIEQDGSTADMIFPVAAIIEFVSRIVTLQPGDVISTGTPDGVGHAKGKFLRTGDLVEAAVQGIGVLRNPVLGESGLA